MNVIYKFNTSVIILHMHVCGYDVYIIHTAYSLFKSGGQ